MKFSEGRVEHMAPSNTALATELGLDFVGSHSQISRYLNCEKKYAYGYRDGFSPHWSSRPMVLGTTMHWLLDSWWTGDIDTSIDAITEHIIEGKELATIEECVSVAEHALWLIRRYDKMYARDREHISEVQVEQQCTFELPQLGERRYGLTCKIDKLFRDARYGNNLFFADHKTTGSSMKEDILDIDNQFSLYTLCLREHDIEVFGSIMDVLYTYQRRAKKETLAWDAYPVEESFVRLPADRSDAHLNVVAAEAYHACDRIWHLRERHFEPLRNISADCGWCEFRSPCFEGLRGDPNSEREVLKEYFTPETKPDIIQAYMDNSVQL